MKLIESVRRRIARLLTAPHEELGHWARFVQFQIQLWRFCARRLRANNAMAMSAALSFRTIFALVPLLVLAALAAKSLGFAEDGKRMLRDVVLKGLSRSAGVAATAPSPASAPAEGAGGGADGLVAQIESVVETVENELTMGQLGPIGAVLLVWAALTLLTTVERCLNRIFGATRSRSLGRRILLYWSVVTLSPLALLAASRVGDRAVAAFQDVPYLSWLVRLAGWGGPIVVAVVLLAALYRLMPNTHVRFRTAARGAVVAVPLWLLAFWAFGLYAAKVGSRSIPGALGLPPVFLVWLNLSWLIFLFGAELAHTAANVRRMELTERAERRVLGPWDFLAAALAVVRGHALGAGPVSVEQVSATLALPVESAERLLSDLAAANVLSRVAGGEAAYVPARPAAAIRVSHVLRAACPDAAGPGRAKSTGDVAEAVERARRRSDAALEDLTVADILPEPE